MGMASIVLFVINILIASFLNIVLITTLSDNCCNGSHQIYARLHFVCAKLYYCQPGNSQDCNVVLGSVPSSQLFYFLLPNY